MWVSTVPTMTTHVPLLDPSAVIPDVILLAHQKTSAFRQRYLCNQPEILFVDPMTPCRLPYQGVVRLDGLGQGAFGEAHLGQLWSFDLIHGWSQDSSAMPMSRCAIKLNSSVMDPNVSDEDYNRAEMSLCFDARGLANAKFGVNALPTQRSPTTKWFAKTPVEDESLSFIEDLYFHHAIHPISAIFTKNGVDGNLRPHSVLGLEYLCGGDLADRLAEARVIPEAEAWSYTRDLLLAIKQCHDSGIAHRDVKLSNICFGQDDKITLIDFGMVENLTPWGTTDCRGTDCYMSPELVEHYRRCEQGLDASDLAPMDGAKLDVYALGMVIYYMLSEEWNEGNKVPVDWADFFAPGFLLLETRAFISGLLASEDERWDVDEAIKQCQIWGDAIAYKCNGPNPLEPLVSTIRDPLGMHSMAPLLIDIEQPDFTEPIKRPIVPVNLPYTYYDQDSALESKLKFIENQLRAAAVQDELDYECSLVTNTFFFPSPNQFSCHCDLDAETATSCSTEREMDIFQCSTCYSSSTITPISLQSLDFNIVPSSTPVLRSRPSLGAAAKRHILHALAPIAAC